MVQRYFYGILKSHKDQTLSTAWIYCRYTRSDEYSEGEIIHEEPISSLDT